ncbi:transcriptional regulator, MerR family [Geofilum rubicundum JCM 15548]|uniref:Transcriptional regulator, MerR family n=2 Tax=Geofilum TaxID=1236988 RepID=A0A0E9M2W8_9BACT|nr:transcriptional regulator, MerR family [Geofilum rubicundum JCM 15548]
MSLGVVAQKAGISSSALSQIENAKAFPSIVTLKAVADVLHITVGELIGENETIKHSPLLIQKDRIFIKQNTTGARLYSLSHRETAKQMGTYLIEIPPNSDTDDFFAEHRGQEFCHVLKGEVQFELDKKTFVAIEGDSLYYNSFKHHKVINQKEEQAIILWVVTPPDTHCELPASNIETERIINK